MTQDFLFSYAQPEAQCSTASSQDSNAFLVVNHWINGIFSLESTFLCWLFGVFEFEGKEEMGEAEAIKESSCEGNGSAKDIVHSSLISLSKH